jgi:hypothetical protein
MQLTTKTYPRELISRAAGMLTSLLLAVTFSAAALAQAPPTLTLKSNFGVFFFGRVNTGALSPNTVITVSNGGATGSVLISNVTITGTNAADFTLVSTTCVNASLTTVGTCTATVRFNPLAVGSRKANLTITDNAAGSQHLVVLRGTGLNPSIPNEAVGPIDPRTGFPLWHQDEQGRRLQLCLDNATLCLTTPPNAGAPSVTTALVNFPEEAFYWSAEAEIDRNIGGRVRLVLAKEAAFTTADAQVGEQITFDRIRVRIDELTPGATYTVTHPFGTLTAAADDNGEIDTTTDIGCGGSPCDFRMSMEGSLNIFLRWDPAFAPAAPAGYLGDPTVAHRVTGSPFNTNIFKVDGPNVGGAGINSIQTNLFTVSGKLF